MAHQRPDRTMCIFTALSSRVYNQNTPLKTSARRSGRRGRKTRSRPTLKEVTDQAQVKQVTLTVDVMLHVSGFMKGAEGQKNGAIERIKQQGTD